MHHAKKQGARLTAAAVERGISFTIVYLEQNATRTREREIKNLKNTPNFVSRMQKHGKTCRIPVYDASNSAFLL